MKRKVYVETTIASYLTSRPSGDVVVAAHQEITRRWWGEQRERYELFVSEIVLLEAARGDSQAASKRLAELRDVSVLAVDDRVIHLGRTLVQRGLIPEKVIEDALHIAIATIQGMDFLLTWNCKHIANGEVIQRLDGFFKDRGLIMPVLCTPEQLMGD